MLTTLLHRLRWSYRKNVPDVWALVTRNYPDFLFSRDSISLANEIPVFTFHSVELISFEEKLQFLRRNGYRTLSGEEFRAAIAGESQFPGQSVVLTFDDGRRSLWDVAFPLLQKYCFKAIAFIIPGLIPDSVSAAGHQEPLVRGRKNTHELLQDRSSEHPLCTWEEIRKMHASGAIDFQSHTLYHQQVCISAQVVDFIHPGFDFYFFGNINVPTYRVDGQLDFSRNMKWGTPVYRAEPRMAGRPMFFDDESLRNACVDFVERHGGEAFFKHHGWRRKLSHFYHSRRRECNNHRLESVEEQRRAMLDDLQRSRDMLQRRLPGKVVDQLCYPWFMGSALSMELAREAGYRVNYWGIVPGRKTNRVGDDLFKVPRIEEHFIFRLPGRGRKSLREIYQAKVEANLPRFKKQMNLLEKRWE